MQRRSASARRPRHALLADRDPDTRSLYAATLTGDCWQVDEAADGREALAKAIAVRPDVVITDSRLPGIDGITLCDLLRRDVATSTIPVVFVTGDVYPADVAKATAAGADLVLTKPCLPEHLLAELRRMLDNPKRIRIRAEEERTSQRLDRADDVLSRAVHTVRPARHSLTWTHQRGVATNPPIGPPTLVCPSCDRPLVYQRSHIGGVNTRHAEQWDYFECPRGCGSYQFRARTRKLRKVA